MKNRIGYLIGRTVEVENIWDSRDKSLGVIIGLVPNNECCWVKVNGEKYPSLHLMRNTRLTTATTLLELKELTNEN